MRSVLPTPPCGDRCPVHTQARDSSHFVTETDMCRLIDGEYNVTCRAVFLRGDSCLIALEACIASAGHASWAPLLITIHNQIPIFHVFIGIDIA